MKFPKATGTCMMSLRCVRFKSQTTSYIWSCTLAGKSIARICRLCRSDVLGNRGRVNEYQLAENANVSNPLRPLKSCSVCTHPSPPVPVRCSGPLSRCTSSTIFQHIKSGSSWCFTAERLTSFSHDFPPEWGLRFNLICSKPCDIIKSPRWGWAGGFPAAPPVVLCLYLWSRLRVESVIWNIHIALIYQERCPFCTLLPSAVNSRRSHFCCGELEPGEGCRLLQSSGNEAV